MADGWMRYVLAPILLALVAAASHLLPGLDSSLVEGGIRNSLHLIGSAAVAAVTYELVPIGRSGKLAVAFLVALGTGVMGEFLQHASGRSADIVDLYRDAAGAGGFLLARWLWSLAAGAGRGAVARRAMRFFAVMAGSLVFAPFAFWTTALVSVRMQAPTILDFDSRWAPYYCRGINAEVALVADGPQDAKPSPDRFAVVTLSKRFRSGIAVDTAIYNWSSFNNLVFEAQVINGEPTSLTVHINDSAHIGHFADTDAGRVIVTGRAQEFRIPLRKLISESRRNPAAINDIRQIVLLARDRQVGALLRVDRISLE